MMNAASTKRCPECDQEIRPCSRPYECSREFGLNPADYHLDLEGVTVTACACGVGFDIASMESLMPRIATQLLESTEALRPSGFRYLRRCLGMTQKDFAELLGVTSVTVCKWEKGVVRPNLAGETNLRARALTVLLRQPPLRGLPASHIRRLHENVLARYSDPTRNPLQIEVAA